MNRLSLFDFKSAKERDQRLSYFSFPMAGKICDTETAGDKHNATNSAHEAIQSSQKRSTFLWSVNFTLLIGIVTLLAIIGHFERRHPFLVLPLFPFNIELASRVFPDISRFYIRASSVKDVATGAGSLPRGAHLGVIYALEKCQPTHIALLAHQAHVSKINSIELVSTTTDWSHVHACVHLLALALRKLTAETQVGIGLTGLPDIS